MLRSCRWGSPMPDSPTVATPPSPPTQAHAVIAVLKKPGAVMAMVRIAGTGLQFMVQMLLGQLGGPAAIALMQTFLSVTTVLGEVIARGTPAAAMRRVAVLWTRGARDAIEQYLKACIDQILMAGLLISLAAIAFATATGFGFGSDGDTGFPGYGTGFVLVGMLAFATQRLFADTAKSMARSSAAVAAETLAPPLVAIIALASLWVTGTALTPIPTLVIGLAALIITSASVALITRQQLMSLPRDHTGEPVRSSVPSREGVALWMVSLMGVMSIQLPFLVLPFFADPDVVGVYAVAFKLLAIATTVLVMLAAVFGPAFARAAEDRDADRTRTLLYKSQLLSAGILLPIAIALLAGSDWLAHWFNVPADLLWQFLMILTLGQAVNAATGLPGLLLNMSGAASKECLIAATCLAASLVATPLIGTRFGAEGIAWLFTAVLMTKNLVSFVTAHRIIGGWRS